MKYEDIQALNWSTLKILNESPKALRYAAENPREPTPAMRLGTAIHCAVLEPERFAREYITEPKFGDLRKTDNKKAKAEFYQTLPDGALIVSDNDSEVILRCAEALSKRDDALELLGGKKEQVAQWVHDGTGIKCKGRLDVAGGRVVDLKTTSLKSVREILNDAARRDYHGQCAWYDDGSREAGIVTGRDLPAAVFVQTVVPFDVVILDMNECPDTYEDGRTLYESLIQQYQGCQTAQWWPGMAPSAIPWTLPKWKTNE